MVFVCTEGSPAARTPEINAPDRAGGLLAPLVGWGKREAGHRGFSYFDTCVRL